MNTDPSSDPLSAQPGTPSPARPFKMTPRMWVYAGIALLLLVMFPFNTLATVILAVVVAVIGRSLYQDIRGPDLTKPVGLFVLRALVPAGMALGLFLWANHIAETIAPQVQMAEMAGNSYEGQQAKRILGVSDDGLKVYQTFILVLRVAGSLAAGIALLRLFHLYRRLEAGQITMTSVLQQIQARTQPSFVAPVAPSADEIEKKVTALKRMKDEGIISEAEYDAKRMELINRM